MLSSLFLSKAENSALSQLFTVAKALAPSGGTNLSFMAIADQLRGHVPAEGFVSEALRMVGKLHPNPSVRNAAVLWTVDALNKRGIEDKVIVSLLQKLGKILSWEMPESTTAQHSVEAVLQNLANLDAQQPRRLNAPCICPECQAVFFI